MKVTVIIPALNEAESIGDVIKDIPRDIVQEVLVVDGHSTDNTPQIVQQAGARVVVQEGKGYGNAISTGIKHATGDILVLIDADGSYETQDIARLVKCLENGYDLAYGSRYRPESGSEDDTWIRFLGNKIFTLLLRWIHGVKLTDSLFFYVAGRKEIFQRIDTHLKSPSFEYCIEFPLRAHKMGFQYTEIPSFEKKRTAGHSKVRAFYDGLRILRVLLRG